MKNKIRLVLGKPVDAPFVNSVPVLVILAVLMLAGSFLLWSDAGDTLFLSREGAETVEATVQSCTVAGQDSYVPRMEITTAAGETFVLLESQVGDIFDALAEEIETRDEISMKLSRKGRVLEVREDDLVHLDFDGSKKAALLDVFVSTAAAVVFDLLALFLLLRAAVLRMNRKSAFRFGPARSTKGPKF